jgi:hypothetical protein
MILSQFYHPKILLIILLRLTSKNKHPRRCGCSFVTTHEPSLKNDAWFCLEETHIVRRIFVSKLSFAIQFRWLLVKVTWINSDAEGHRTIRSVTYTAALYHFCFLWWENKHALEFSILGLYVTRGHVPFRRDTLVLWLPSGCLHCTLVLWLPSDCLHCTLVLWLPSDCLHCTLFLWLPSDCLHCTLVLWLPSGCLHCTPVIIKGDQIREDKVRFSKGGGIRSL